MQNNKLVKFFIKSDDRVRSSTLHLHFRGIPFIIDVLGISTEKYDYYARGYNPKNCEHIKTEEGAIESGELIRYLNFAISDIVKNGGLDFFLSPSNEENLIISVSYQSDIALISMKESKIAEKVENLRQKYPLLFYN